MRARRTPLRLVLAGLLLTSACGADRSPVEAAPELGTRLDRVDAAIADGDLDRARTALKALATSTDRALDAGDLSDEQAARIDDAVAALLDRLPGATPTDDPTPSSPSPSEQETEQEPEQETETTPSAPETSQSTAPEKTPKPPKPPKGKGGGKHKGKGH